MSFNTKAIVILVILIATIGIALVLVPPPGDGGAQGSTTFEGPKGEPFVRGPSVPPPGNN